ncbi:hypothetical protein U27_01412 [Candidatus Vecturithrix granuli]|uniref:Uncharacterized protein n=1 Tax=Vecturithrix granuli TaxID=1499967 RepID=A0A081CAA6_VECG1|nr:hypothetical protein U27_01412 [Candidatus Vecturithrix granuli]
MRLRVKTLIKPWKGLKQIYFPHRVRRPFRENPNKTLEGIKTRDEDEGKLWCIPSENPNKTLEGIKTIDTRDVLNVLSVP